MDVSEDGILDTIKTGNLNGLKSNFYYDTVTMKLIEEETQCQ